MLKKYLHPNKNNTEIIICIDNLCVHVSGLETYNPDFEPEASVEQYPTNAEARRAYRMLCVKLKRQWYTKKCIK